MQQSWVATLNQPGQLGNLPAAAALNTSTTLTDITPGAAANGALIIPANTLDVGSTLRVVAGGVWGNTGTPTLLIGLYYGAVAGTLLAATAATTTTTAASNWQWRLEWTGSVRTRGTTGTIMGSGFVMLATSATAFAIIPIPNATPQTAVTIDTTTAKALTIGAQWGTSNASNTITCNYFSAESLV